MIEAEAHRKLGAIEDFALASEDYLTSCTFGLLKYLPGSALLSTLEGVKWHIAAPPCLPSLEDWLIFKFWDTSRAGNEIDVLVETPSDLFGFEIKFQSPMSGREGKKHQLWRYAEDLKASSESQNKTPFLIYLTPHATCPERDLSPEQPFATGVHIGWLSWSEWMKALTTWGKEHIAWRHIVKDIEFVLDNRGLLAFAGFGDKPTIVPIVRSDWFLTTNPFPWPEPPPSGPRLVWDFGITQQRPLKRIRKGAT